MIENALEMLRQQAHLSQGGDKEAKSASASASSSATSAAAENGEANSSPTVSADAAAAASSSSSSKEHTWTGVTTTNSAKSHVLEAIKALIAKQPVPGPRASMRLRITRSAGVLKQAVKAPAAEKGNGKKGAKGRRGDDDDECDDGRDKKAPGTVKDKILSDV